MGKYSATILWKRNGARFTDNRYKRSHSWEFENGGKIAASASPDIVPAPLSDPEAIDPEETFVAALSSCHMLWFLSIAAKRGFIIEKYRDTAEGVMGKDNTGRLAITEVTLYPHVLYKNGAVPSLEENTEMHHEAHQECFLANSVKTKIAIESSMSTIGSV
jgi:organic hydroperoxide reductase OsmC/OhrA